MATPTTLPAAFVAGNVLTAAQLNDLRGAFRVLQVLSVQKTDTFTTSSSTLVDLTGLTLTVTPSATTSQILVGYAVQGSGITGTNMGMISILRGATAIGNAAAAGSRVAANAIVSEMAAAAIAGQANFFLDSPATTSATTYKLQIRTGSGGTVFVNRTNTDADSAAYGRGTSSLIVMEISA